MYMCRRDEESPHITFLHQEAFLHSNIFICHFPWGFQFQKTGSQFIMCYSISNIIAQ